VPEGTFSITALAHTSTFHEMQTNQCQWKLWGRIQFTLYYQNL